MAEFPETNHSLVARVRDLGDGASWTEFLAIYQPVVYRMARRRGLQEADAQDVVQQVFHSISRAIDRWQPSPTQPLFRAWLVTIARNTITNALNRRPRDAATGSTSVMELLQERPDPSCTTELHAETEKEFILWAAAQIRNEFSESTWDVFWRSTIEGQSVAEVVKATGRTTGSVYVTRYRVISRLKEKIDHVVKNWDLQEFSQR